MILTLKRLTNVRITTLEPPFEYLSSGNTKLSTYHAVLNLVRHTSREISQADLARQLYSIPAAMRLIVNHLLKIQIVRESENELTTCGCCSILWIERSSGQLDSSVFTFL